MAASFIHCQAAIKTTTKCPQSKVLIQMIAGITVNNGHQFTPGQFLAMGQQRGLDAASKSAITGFITKEDDIGTVESPFGKVQLVQLIGVKAEEIEQMKRSCAQ